MFTCLNYTPQQHTKLAGSKTIVTQEKINTLGGLIDFKKEAKQEEEKKIKKEMVEPAAAAIL